jgi:hypothetical protein
MAKFRIPLTRTTARTTRGAAVHHEVANREIIVVEKGFVVDLVHYGALDQILQLSGRPSSSPAYRSYIRILILSSTEA